MGKIKKLPKGLQFDGKSYIIDVFVNGNRIKKRLGEVSQKEAEAKLEEYKTDSRRGELVTFTASSLTVIDVLEHYWEKHLQHMEYGKNAKFLLSAVNRLIGDKKIINLRRSDIDDYKRIRGSEKTKNKDPKKSHPISPRTIQAELQHLSMAITRAVDDELLPRNPVTKFCTIKVPRKRKIVLDHGGDFGNDWIRLYKSIPERWRLFFVLMYESGLRPSEAKKFRCEWVKQVNGGYIIEIPPPKEKTDFSDRRIPISKILEKRLIPVTFGNEGYLFKHSDYYKMIRKAVKESGVDPDVKAKTMRKTRLTIWDAIDEGACRVAAGHVPRDPHEESYVEITNARLMRLVGIEIDQKLRIFKQA